MGLSTISVNNLLHELEPVADAGHDKVDITGTVLDVIATTINLAEQTRTLLIQVETATVRVTVGGVDPDATTGIQLTAGQQVWMSRQEWLSSRWIREGSTDAVLQIAHYGRP